MFLPYTQDETDCILCILNVYVKYVINFRKGVLLNQEPRGADQY